MLRPPVTEEYVGTASPTVTVTDCTRSPCNVGKWKRVAAGKLQVWLSDDVWVKLRSDVHLVL